jgi:hypothetical protein
VRQATAYRGATGMVKIWFNDLRIQSISQSSGVFSGHNAVSGWKHYSKINEGFGKIQGENNVVEYNRHVVMDNDWIESIRKKDDKRWES